MNMRKIAVAGTFAAGAALAFAPLASADDLTSTIDSEIASLNSIFQGDLSIADVPSTDYTLGGTGVFDTINLGDVSAVQDGTGATPVTTPFDYLVYGVDPTAAGLSTDPGSYDVYNGALTEFDDAYNALVYAADYNNDLIPATDLFGSATEIGTALGTGTDMGAAGDFFSAGLADLAGFFGI